jgi:hypothetical protein
MNRMDPAFDETADGHPSFTHFLRSRSDEVLIRSTPSGTYIHLCELGPVAEPLDLAGIAGSQALAAAPGGEIELVEPLAPGLYGATAAKARTIDVEELDKPTTQNEGSPVDPEITEARRRLALPRGGYVTPELEAAAVQAIRIGWPLCAPDSENSYTRPPIDQIRQVLLERGYQLETVVHATRLAFASHPFLLRDSTMRLLPNPELQEMGDERLLIELRAAFLNLARAASGPSEPLGVLVEAIHGDDLSSEEFSSLLREYERAYTLPSWRRIAQAIGPMLLPAPVLWDVAAAALALQPDTDLSTAEALASALSGPLVEIERPADTVPFDALFLSFTASGLLTRAALEVNFKAPGPDTQDIVAPIVRAWANSCSENQVPITVEGLYRLVLPDRFQIFWRDWVRRLVPEAITL